MALPGTVRISYCGGAFEYYAQGSIEDAALQRRASGDHNCVTVKEAFSRLWLTYLFQSHGRHRHWQNLGLWQLVDNLIVIEHVLQFINLLSGTNLEIGRELESCTTAVQLSHPVFLDGYLVTLIDTPGFDDSRLKDSDVLAMIAAHLSFTYAFLFQSTITFDDTNISSHKNGKVLAGIVYMHRISDNRMGGIALRNFKMFRHLCGDSSLQNVLIVTNMWGQVDQDLGETREQELATKDMFYKPALDKGARLARHNGTAESGKAILRTLFERRPQILQIQHELESGMDLAETSAGKHLNNDLIERIAMHREEIRTLVDGMNEASRLRDEQTRKELGEDRSRLEAELRRLQADSKNLATGYAEALERLEKKMQDMANMGRDGTGATSEREVQICIQEQCRRLGRDIMADNAVLEAKLGGAFPVFGFWGKLALMLSPFSLSWK